MYELKILLFSQWFEPEPTFKGLDFAKALILLGHEVEVLTGFPNYPGGKVYDGFKIKPYLKEVVDGVVVHRVALYPDHGKSAIKRIFNYVSFGFSSFLFGLFNAGRYDVIYVYHPPLTTGISAALFGFFRRKPFVIDIQDLWPDTLSATKMINNQRILSVVGFFCKWVYRRASQIVVLSPGFKDRLEKDGVPTDKISVIYNWCKESAMNVNDERVQLPAGFNIVFAGNLGHAQGIPSLIEGAKIVSQENLNVNLVLIGDGVALEDAKLIVSEKRISNVHFIPRVPMEKISNYLHQADALLVHLTDDELFRITIPSRTQAYLRAGRPILMGVAGDASQLINDACAGITFKPDTPQYFADAVKILLSKSEHELAEMGANGINFYNKNLSLLSGILKFQNVFEKAVNSK